ncbi:MAG: PrsW family intramembrane metalloprotease [Anaerolineales bacterium]|nr:PrsW family intramembrane metalloprotease [Anaerolineales bacterium]
MNNSTPTWHKRTVMIIGLILAIMGLPFTINLLCIVPLLLINSSGSDAAIYGVVSLTFALLTFGAGAVAYIHGNRALKDKPSNPIRFTLQPMLMLGAFILLLSIGLVFQSSDFAVAILFPPIMLACAMLPPLWAVIWMIPRAQQKQVKEPSEEHQEGELNQPSLSWRRGLLAFTGGATVSVFIAIVLEILLPVVIFALISDLADTVADSMRVVFRELSSRDVANALTDRGFIYLFTQLAIIAPLAEEIAKPLVVLPLVRNLNKQETFWIGALAGAGFAALENVVYATSGFYIWAGILLVRALGSALHPLGSGLVALGWRDVLRGEKDAGKNWWKRFGIATTVHAVWNGGSLLVISLGGARFFGDLPPEIDILGLSAAGTTLAFLIILGISALWIGRAYGHDKPFLLSEGTSDEERFIPSDRAAAIWAIACLIAIVPAGIAGLKLWLP